MRTAFYLTVLLLLTSLSGVLHTQAEPPIDGATVEITEDETWNESASMSGELFVKNGSTLTISDVLTVATGNVINIESGSTLTVSGSILGDEVDSGLSVLNSTQLQLNFGDLAETGQLRFDFE